MNETSDVLDGAIPPQQNTALFGHEDAAAFLAKAYRSGKIHHSVLIDGPRGIGKATLAFRFANHVLRYPNPSDAPLDLGMPDADGEEFRRIAAGASHHLLHLSRPVDEKTGRTRTAITVDEVRRAGRFFSQTSGTGNWRIVVVDPADDLNRAAANAILKILEEPPRNALFLVLSHAPGKLLPTIRSRCLPLRLKPLPDPALRQALGHLGFAGSDLDAVVARAGGSLERALMMLRYGGLDIAASFESIMRAGPEAGRREIHRLAETLTGRDRETAFSFFQSELADWINDRARQSVSAGDVESAARIAALSGQIDAVWGEAAAYNLDRKQAVLTVFSTVFSAGAA